MLPYGTGICNYALFESGSDKSDESPWYQHVLALCFCCCCWFFVCLFLKRVISDWLFLRKFVFEACMFCFTLVSRLSLWILKNFAVSWRLCGRGGCIVIRFQSWCNPLWLTGLKEPTRKLTLGGWVISAYANCTPSKIPQGLILREGSSVLAWHDLVWEAQIASARFTSE